MFKHIKTDKYVVLNIKRRADNNVQQTYTLNKSSETKELKCVRNTKDLGVIMDDMLSFTEHISEKIKNAYSMLGIIKRNFKKMDEDTFITLYKTMVRSKLEYAASVWSPHKKTLINTIEKVQKRATKMIRKYSFSVRSAKLWNSLPDSVIKAETTNLFKNRLDKFWEDQEFKYDHKADI